MSEIRSDSKWMVRGTVKAFESMLKNKKYVYSYFNTYGIFGYVTYELTPELHMICLCIGNERPDTTIAFERIP